MQNLAYRIEVELDETAPTRAEKPKDNVDVCAACGEQLLSRDAEACSW